MDVHAYDIWVFSSLVAGFVFRFRGLQDGSDLVWLSLVVGLLWVLVKMSSRGRVLVVFV